MTSQHKKAETPIKKETEVSIIIFLYQLLKSSASSDAQLTGPIRQSSVVTSSTRHAPYPNPLANPFAKLLWGATSQQPPRKSDESIFASSTLLNDFSAIHTRIEDTVKRLQTDNATITEENRQLREQLAGMKTGMEGLQKEKTEWQEKERDVDAIKSAVRKQMLAVMEEKQSMEEERALRRAAEDALKQMKEAMKKALKEIE